MRGQDKIVEMMMMMEKWMEWETLMGFSKTKDMCL